MSENVRSINTVTTISNLRQQQRAAVARANGVNDTKAFKDAPTEWLIAEIQRVAASLESETGWRQYRLGLIAGYVAILAGRAE